MPDTDVAMLKFHWEKWRAEAKAFWRNAALATLILMLFVVYQLDGIKWKIPWLEYTTPTPDLSSQLNRWFFSPMSWCLLLYIVHAFVDLMRHRVPDNVESLIHNDTINFGPFSPRIPLTKVGRGLYLITFALYFAILTRWVLKATLHVWTTSA